MSRINSSWFEFNGTRSDAMGIRLTDAHSFARGGARGTRESVAGRDGYVWIGDGAAEAFEIKCGCRAPMSRLRQISAWLAGSGSLRFSREQGAMYDARIIRAIEYARAVPGEDALYGFTVVFSCQPFARIWPEAQPIVITKSGAQITNPGSAPSLPRIEVVGSGSFALTIGKQMLRFVNVSGGIIVDSELGDAFTQDGALLANDHINGELFKIQPGVNYVSWLTGGALEEGSSPGSVTSVTITPRWRMM